MMSDVELKFWSQVQIGDGCWDWCGHKSPRGYGTFWSGEKNFRAHRWSYMKVNGPITSDQFVCHCCDNPSCVRPSHLWLGDPSTNAKDMAAKHRSIYGEKHRSAKLTAAKVQDIRRRAAGGEYHRVLAKEFGVTRQQVSQIVNWSCWTHEPPATEVPNE